MDFSIDTIIALISLFIGGGGGAFFTWRYQRRKAQAEAESAEISATKEMQDMYQQMLADANTYLKDSQNHVEELRSERDHYKHDRDELRAELEKLTKQFLEFKMDNEREVLDMKRDIARNGRMVECMRPFLCGREGCAIRVPVAISADGDVETKRPSKKQKDVHANDIEPINQDDL